MRSKTAKECNALTRSDRSDSNVIWCKSGRAWRAEGNLAMAWMAARRVCGDRVLRHLCKTEGGHWGRSNAEFVTRSSGSRSTTRVKK